MRAETRAREGGVPRRRFPGAWFFLRLSLKSAGGWGRVGDGNRGRVDRGAVAGRRRVVGGVLVEVRLEGIGLRVHGGESIVPHGVIQLSTIRSLQQKVYATSDVQSIT